MIMHGPSGEVSRLAVVVVADRGTRISYELCVRRPRPQASEPRNFIQLA